MNGTTVPAAAYAGNGQMTIVDAPTSPPAAGEVQVEVAYVGLCGTDLHILHGNMDARVTMPAVIGHEMSGSIAEVGSDVTDWKVGDRITVMPLAWDGTCPACRAGNQHICQNLDFIGIDSPGALQSRWNVPAAALVRLPDDLDLQIAALAEPVAVAVHDVRRGEVAAGDKVVVIGGGPIGLLIASVARVEGADVRIIELDATRSQVARELGFNVIDPRAEDQQATVEAWTGGAGADVVFEVSGASAAVLGATSLAKVRGTIVVVAIHPDPRPLDLQRVFWRELRILGARVYQRRDFERAVDLLTEGSIPHETMITDVLPLDQTQAAFEQLQSGGAMKILVDVQAGGAA
ncbi:zinc-binding dehydrogenase [Microbacterium sp. AK031]|uniref:zinc-dependent alcohol dehydrogenase n=1 Tax=Microbacterium sp. AK031 TaxID=2723076 RepID=UPI002166CF23|nr:alcohol dehydrogenase catalytic domain-containing protein [Microbacterium sp. AK031]MCS3844124.1 2-desacetyl-2-hydroxyethyl bacteriochlorophyllide A dehydrogenase [Microbacterium sp. AK031]